MFWGKWVRGVFPPVSEEQIALMAEHTGKPREEVEKTYAEIREMDTCWLNAVYQVNVRDCGKPPDGWPPMVHLSIKRRDKKPVGKERFRDFQRIKNELVGVWCEGCELYPDERRLVDSANQYHLWVFKTPGACFPFGFKERLVLGGSGAGAKQRPFK